MNAGYLREMLTSVDEGVLKILLVIGLVFLVQYFCYDSLTTIFGVAVFGHLVTKQYLGDMAENLHPLLCGLFVGAVANIIFSHLAKIVHASMDTTFYCIALEAENGCVQAKHKELHKLIKSEIYKELCDYDDPPNMKDTPASLIYRDKVYLPHPAAIPVVQQAKATVTSSSSQTETLSPPTEPCPGGKVRNENGDCSAAQEGTADHDCATMSVVGEPCPEPDESKNKCVDHAITAIPAGWSYERDAREVGSLLARWVWHVKANILTR